MDSQTGLRSWRVRVEFEQSVPFLPLSDNVSSFDDNHNCYDYDIIIKCVIIAFLWYCPICFRKDEEREHKGKAETKSVEHLTNLRKWKKSNPMKGGELKDRKRSLKVTRLPMLRSSSLQGGTSWLRARDSLRRNRKFSWKTYERNSDCFCSLANVIEQVLTYTDISFNISTCHGHRPTERNNAGSSVNEVREDFERERGENQW